MTPAAVQFRSLRGCDTQPVKEFYSHLSPRTRYLRFFSPMPMLPDSVLKLLACGDDQQHLTVLAQVNGEHGPEIVALGNVGPSDDGAAEIGLVVRDDFQRQGIGTMLAAKMLGVAEARGFRRFVGYVLWENSAVVRKLLTHVADIVSARTHQGVSEMYFIPRRSS